MFTSTSLILLLFSSSGLLAAQDGDASPEATQAATEQASDADSIVRTYPVADLIEVAPANGYGAGDFGDGLGGGGGFGGGGAGLGAGRPPETSAKTEAGNELLAAITSTISPDAWASNGGSQASLTLYRGNLVIRASADAHEQVAALLSDLRGTRAFIVEAVFTVLPNGALAEDGRMLADGVEPTTSAMAGIRLNAFDGRTFAGGDGETQAYVATVSPVVAQSAVGYDPQIATVPSGIRLAGRVIAVDDAQVILSGDASLSKLESLDNVSLDGGNSPTSSNISVQTPRTSSVDQSVAARLPLGRWVVLGTIAKPESESVSLVVRVREAK